MFSLFSCEVEEVDNQNQSILKLEKVAKELNAKIEIDPKVIKENAIIISS